MQGCMRTGVGVETRCGFDDILYRGDRIMMRDHSEELFKKYGFEKGLDLLNVLTARQFGLITERHAVDFVRKNVAFFAAEMEPSHTG